MRIEIDFGSGAWVYPGLPPGKPTFVRPVASVTIHGAIHFHVDPWANALPALHPNDVRGGFRFLAHVLNEGCDGHFVAVLCPEATQPSFCLIELSGATSACLPPPPLTSHDAAASGVRRDWRMLLVGGSTWNRPSCTAYGRQRRHGQCYAVDVEGAAVQDIGIWATATELLGAIVGTP